LTMINKKSRLISAESNTCAPKTAFFTELLPAAAFMGVLKN